MPHRKTRLPSDVLAAAPVNPAKPGPGVNSLPFPISSPPGPTGLERRLQEPVSKQHQGQPRVPCTSTQPGGAGWALLPPDLSPESQFSGRSLMMAAARVQE